MTKPDKVLPGQRWRWHAGQTVYVVADITGSLIVMSGGVAPGADTLMNSPSWLYLGGPDDSDVTPLPEPVKPRRYQKPVPCPKCGGSNTVTLFQSIECQDCDVRQQTAAAIAGLEVSMQRATMPRIFVPRGGGAPTWLPTNTHVVLPDDDDSED